MSELTESGLNLYAEFRGHERAEHMRNATESEDFGATMTTLAYLAASGREAAWTATHAVW